MTVQYMHTPIANPHRKNLLHLEHIHAWLLISLLRFICLSRFLISSSTRVDRSAHLKTSAYISCSQISTRWKSPGHMRAMVRRFLAEDWWFTPLPLPLTSSITREISLNADQSYSSEAIYMHIEPIVQYLPRFQSWSGSHQKPRGAL